MTQEFDPRKSYLTVKAHEKMIAYVGFKVDNGKDDKNQEGVIKISSFQRPYGGGHYTLTFIVDTSDDSLKEVLKTRFDSLTEASLKPYLGKDMQKIVKVSLDSLEKIPEWYVEEVSVHLNKMDERVNVLIGTGLADPVPGHGLESGETAGSGEWSVVTRRTCRSGAVRPGRAVCAGPFFAEIEIAEHTV